MKKLIAIVLVGLTLLLVGCAAKEKADVGTQDTRTSVETPVAPVTAEESVSDVDTQLGDLDSLEEELDLSELDSLDQDLELGDI